MRGEGGKKIKKNYVAEKLKELEDRLKKERDPKRARMLQKQVAQWEAWVLDKDVRG